MRSPPHLRCAVLGVVALTLLAWLAPPAQAAITASGTAITVQAAPGGTLNNGTLESNTNIFVWFERTATLGAALNTDHNGSAGTSAAPTAGTIAAGTTVDSYYVHADQVGGAGNTTLANAAQQFITFDRQILGLIWTGTPFTASDGPLSPPGLTYGTLTNRGLEAADSWTITSTATTWTLTINSWTINGATVDDLRVITANAGPLAVPEPGTWALFALGTLGLAGFVGRRRRQRRGRDDPAGEASPAA